MRRRRLCLFAAYSASCICPLSGFVTANVAAIFRSPNFSSVRSCTAPHRQEISLYTKYAVRLKEDGKVRHIYNTKIFKDELSNIMEDSFLHMSRENYEKERGD